MTAKILVPIDFSPNTESVVSWAASIARDRKASLILLHVQEPIAESLGADICFSIPLAEDPGIRRALVAVVPDDPTIACEHRLLLGPAPNLIVDVAGNEDADLIVMGSHGRGWLGRLLMGSVAQHVMRHATCPVLIVKQQCAHPAESHPREAVAASRSATSTSRASA